MSEQLSIKDFALSMTYFDHLAIEKAFGLDSEHLSATANTYALAFVHLRRQGKTDAEAKEAAFSMSTKEVMNLFGIDEDEIFADDPSTQVGKDDSLNGSEQ